MPRKPPEWWQIHDTLVDLMQSHRTHIDSPPKCYVSGPMTGLPNFNEHSFNQAAKLLRAAGWFVFSPVENDAERGIVLTGQAGTEEFDFKTAMAVDLQQVCQSDAVFVIPGWEYSAGAQIEVDVAHRVGVPVYSYLSGREIEAPAYEPHEFSSRIQPCDGGDGQGCFVPHSGCVCDGELPADSKPTNPKDVIGSTKMPMHLWPETATMMGAMGLLEGALKYGRSNWRVAGVRASIYVDALRRHVGAWFEGEDNAPDSGLPHLSHALACLAILVDAQAAGKLVDDRQIRGGHLDLIEELTPHVERLKGKYADRDPKHYTIEDTQAA